MFFNNKKAVAAPAGNNKKFAALSIEMMAKVKGGSEGATRGGKGEN